MRLGAEDELTFAAEAIPRLVEAVADLSLLIERGYPEKATLALVGDRWSLDARQRVAVRRCAAGERELALRDHRRLEPSAISGRTVAIDGYNVLTTVSCAEAGRAILIGRDGCCRDLAALRGNFENAELVRAADRCLATLARLGAGSDRWLFDDPVSGSGELAALLRSRNTGVPIQAATVRDPDAELISGSEICATSDSRVLEECQGWVNLARWTIEDHFPGAWIIDLAKKL